jgi:hypothetical protein
MIRFAQKDFISVHFNQIELWPPQTLVLAIVITIASDDPGPARPSCARGAMAALKVGKFYQEQRLILRHKRQNATEQL